MTNNMTQSILPCLFSQTFIVQTRERASQVRAHASQMTVPSLASLLVFGSLLLRALFVLFLQGVLRAK